ncbi:MAG: hypothetical protein M3Y39_01135 [Chloroflexota bacterium]|nr:hypothetical protein [Chloroflexota bacterium]
MEPERFVFGNTFGEKAEAKSLRLKGLLEAAEALLKEAGCEIVRAKGTTDILLTYPAGTTRQEIFARSMESRFRVLLPDGLELREIASRDRGCVALFILAETVPQRAAGEEQAE